MAKYRIDTDKGSFLVETDEPDNLPSANELLAKQGLQAAPASPVNKLPTPVDVDKVSKYQDPQGRERMAKDLYEQMKWGTAKGIGSTAGLIGGGIPGMLLGAATTNPENVGGTVGGTVAGAATNLIPGATPAKLALKGALTGAGYLLGNQAQTGKTPSGMDAAITVGGGAAIPGAAGALTSPATINWLVGNALKVPKNISVEDRNRIFQTIVKNRLLATPEGTKKLDQKVSDLYNKAQAKVAAAPGVVAPHDVADDVLRYMKTSPDVMQAAPGGAEDAIKDKVQDFLVRNAKPLTVAEANKMKQATQAVVRRSSGYDHGMKDVGTEVDKAFANALRSQVENRVPDVGGINSRIQELLKAEPYLQGAVNREANKYPFGLIPILVGLSTHAATGNPLKSLAATAAMRVADHAATKTAVANGLDMLPKPTTGNPSNSVIALLNALKTAKIVK